MKYSTNSSSVKPSSTKIPYSLKNKLRKQLSLRSLFFRVILIYTISYNCRVSICRLSRGGAFRCLCRISTPYSRRTHLSSSIRDCDMARIYFPTPPRNRLCRYYLGDSRYGCWCTPIYCRRKAPMQSTIQLGKCSSGRALCPRIRPRNLRN